VTQFQQSDTALLMIRIMDSFISVAILCGTIILAWSYPLTRERYQRIQKLLAIRRNKNAETT
jgi:Na+/melibiose symporter-like transporter